MRFFVSQFAEMRKQFTHAHFAIVYIEEAHAEDEWPVRSARYNHGVPVRVNQPKTLIDRMEIAKEFVTRFGLTDVHTVVDNPEDDNPFSSAFSPWPIRFFVVQHGKMAFIANPVDCEYSMHELTEALRE